MISLRCFFASFKIVHHDAENDDGGLNDVGQKRSVGNIDKIIDHPTACISECPKAVAPTVLLANAHGKGYTSEENKNVGEFGENEDVDHGKYHSIDGDEPIGERFALALKEVVDDRLCRTEAAGNNAVKCAGQKIACCNEGV